MGAIEVYVEAFLNKREICQKVWPRCLNKDNNRDIRELCL